MNNKDLLVKRFNDQQVDAMVGIDKMPDNIDKDAVVKENSIPLDAQVMGIFQIKQ